MTIAAPEAPSTQPPSDAPSWAFVVGPAAGGQVRDLSGARNRKCSFKLSDPSEASCELDGRSFDAAYLDELATDLHVFRSPRPGARKQRLYRGRIGKSSDTFDQDKHSVSVPSLDYRALLKRRLLMSGSQLTWTQKDQAVIAQGLIDQAQRLPGGDYGIGLGRLQGTGVLRDRTYELGDAIGDKLQELSDVDNGFEWDITATGPAALQLDIWYPQRGADRGVILELGGAVVSGSRDVDSSEYANHIRLSGQQGSASGSTAPPTQERMAPDVATNPAGRWDRSFSAEISTATALTERADWQIAESQVVRPSYTLALKPGFWRGPDHLWVGDTVTVRIYSGRLKVNSKLRVQQIDVDISDTGTEAVSVNVGAPKPDYRKRASDVDRRLTSLERR